MTDYVHYNFILIQTIKQCDMYIKDYIFHMHYYGVLKQQLSVYNTLSTRRGSR